MENGIITARQLIEDPNKYDGQEIFLKDIKLVPRSVIKYKDTIQDGYKRPSFYCLVELDEKLGLVLPFGVNNDYVQEVRPSTYHALLRGSEGKLVSARGKFQNWVTDTQDLEETIAQVPEVVDKLHQLGTKLPSSAEKIAAGIDRNIRGKLTDIYGINLHNHYFMEGCIIPAFQLFSQKSVL